MSFFPGKINKKGIKPLDTNQGLLSTNGISLHVVREGSSDAPLLILLHGFPEFWYGWRKQIPYFSGRGFQVWAPDQRGYNLSDKPSGISAYQIDQLALDVIGLIDAAGEEAAYVVGHDWGAAVAWWLAARHPGRVRAMTVINVPHPVVMRRYLTCSIRQLMKSWYIFFFQLPWLPETLTKGQNWKLAVRALQGTSLPGTFTGEDLDRYRAAWSQPGAYTAMLNWYRALLQKPSPPLKDARITVPTLLLWGAQDRFLDARMARESISLCDEGRLVMFENATHWVQHEEAHTVNQLISSFLSQSN